MSGDRILCRHCNGWCLCLVVHATFLFGNQSCERWAHACRVVSASQLGRVLIVVKLHCSSVRGCWGSTDHLFRPVRLFFCWQSEGDDSLSLRLGGNRDVQLPQRPLRKHKLAQNAALEEPLAFGRHVGLFCAPLPHTLRSLLSQRVWDCPIESKRVAPRHFDLAARDTNR